MPLVRDTEHSARCATMRDDLFGQCTCGAVDAFCEENVDGSKCGQHGLWYVIETDGYVVLLCGDHYRARTGLVPPRVKWVDRQRKERHGV